MKRAITIVVCASAIIAGGLLCYLLQPDIPVVEVEPTGGYSPQRAAVVIPDGLQNLAGNYVRGDGTGYNLRLVLDGQGTFSATWHGCLGKYGDADGYWYLEGARLGFIPISETGMMQGYLKSLEALRFKDNWILVPAAEEEREFYERWGVSRLFVLSKRGKHLSRTVNSQFDA